MMLAALLAAGPVSAEAAETAGKVGGRISTVPNTLVKGAGRAVEGDMVSVNGMFIRLMGVDAPDPGQLCRNRYGHELDCFRTAKDVLGALVDGQEVECTVADQDRNATRMGECRVRGVDLGGAMVARGWAFAYRSLTGAYQRSESYAQSKRLGLWAGQVEKPWEWRSRKLRERAR